MTGPRVELAPSILAADFARLGEQVAAVAPFSGRIHVDVMDGHFVPNLSMGPVVVRSLRPVTDLPLEVHLMTLQPARFVEPFVDAGADRLVFHVEAVDDPVGLADEIQRRGVAAGVAMKPETPGVSSEVLRHVDLVIVMTVEPGFGGQPFMEEMLGKVQEIREAINTGGLEVDIEVDGGVDPTTAARAREAGANVFVAGNAIFGSSDPAGAAADILRAIEGERLDG